MDEPFYATSWALFSFLLNERYDQLGRYLGRLNESSEDRRAKAWGEVFADLPPDKLDDALRSWLRGGTMALPRIHVTVQETPTRERPLSDADVLAARSLLDFKFKDEATAMRTLSEALMIDRTNLLALLIDAAHTHSIEPDDARATTAAHPDDWRAWRLLAFALKGSPEGYRALGRACALAAQRSTRMRSPARVIFADSTRVIRESSVARPWSWSTKNLACVTFNQRSPVHAEPIHDAHPAATRPTARASVLSSARRAGAKRTRS